MKEGEFRLKTPNDLSKVGRCLCFLPKAKKGKEEQRERGRRREKTRTRFSVGARRSGCSCRMLSRLPRACTKNPFRCAPKGKSARKVRLIGLEPTRLATPDPKSGASTNFATSAFLLQKYIMCHDRQRKGRTFFVQWCRIGIFANQTL